jgi:hypothetical protein
VKSYTKKGILTTDATCTKYRPHINNKETELQTMKYENTVNKKEYSIERIEMAGTIFFLQI